jgi:hypothetical protein
VEQWFVTFSGDTAYVPNRQSNDWMAGAVAKPIGCRFYDMTMAMGSTRRFHAKQMQLRSAQLTGEIFTAFP